MEQKPGHVTYLFPVGKDSVDMHSVTDVSACLAKSIRGDALSGLESSIPFHYWTFTWHLILVSVDTSRVCASVKLITRVFVYSCCMTCYVLIIKQGLRGSLKSTVIPLYTILSNLEAALSIYMQTSQMIVVKRVAGSVKPTTKII